MSKVLLPLGSCDFTCLVQTQNQSTDQGIEEKQGYRSMIYTLYFLKSKVRIKEFNEIQGTDQQPPGDGDLYLGFHWIP